MKKAIVIGASSGIGKVLATLLVQDGYRVGITGRRGELLTELELTAPEHFVSKAFDVCNTDLTLQKLDELVDELGGLDLLIISSGTGDINKNLDFNIEQQTIATNVMGWTCVADWAFRYFEKQRSGHLVGISSIGGLRGSAQAPAYNATKAYQQNYLEGLAQKASKPHQAIYVTDIRPGLVATGMAKGEGLFWVMPVDKVAQQIYKAIQSKKQMLYVTKRWAMIAFLLKRIPRVLYIRM